MMCQMLRCARCQKKFTVPRPSQAWSSKKHPSVDAVVSALRYAMGMPHHRLAQWQKYEVAGSVCLCLLFIHPGAPNLISLRSAGTMPA